MKSRQLTSTDVERVLRSWIVSWYSRICVEKGLQPTNQLSWMSLITEW